MTSFPLPQGVIDAEEKAILALEPIVVDFDLAVREVSIEHAAIRLRAQGYHVIVAERRLYVRRPPR